MSIFDTLNIIIIKIRVFFRKIINKLVFAKVLVFLNIGLFIVFYII